VERFRNSAEETGKNKLNPPLLVGSKLYCALEEWIYFYIPDNNEKNQKRLVGADGRKGKICLDFIK
jgi:hypothetical protein